MRIEVHVHTEKDTDIFRGEKRDFQGQIAIPGTKATFQHYGLTEDKNKAMGTSYILNCWLTTEPIDLDKVADWLFNKVRDKADRITIGDIHKSFDYVKIDRDEILTILLKRLKN